MIKKALKISIFLTFLAFGGHEVAFAQSGYTPGNLKGYAWSSNIGWISLNCLDGSTTGGSVCGTGTGQSNYSVNVNPTTGAFSGYAWSSNIGWLSFQSSDVTSQCGTVASLNLTTNKVSGWGRFLSGSTTSGWDGCINMGTTGTTTPAYAVKYVTSATPNLIDYAWGSDVVGWVIFRGTLTLGGPSVDLKVNYSGTTNDGPVTIPSAGATVRLSWTTNNVTSCTSTGTGTGTGLGAIASPSQSEWSSTTPTPTTGATVSVPVATNSTGATIAHVYTLTCTNGTTTASDNVVVNVLASNAPYLSLLVNGSTGPITVDSGTAVRLTYTTQNITPNTCLKTASPAYTSWTTNTPTTSPVNVIPSSFTSSTNTSVTASFDTAPLTATQVFSITSCNPVAGGSPLTASVTVNVASPSCEVAPTPYVYSAPTGGTSISSTQYYGVIWRHTGTVRNTILSISPGSSGGFTPSIVAGTDGSSSTTLTSTHTNVGIRVTGTSPSSVVGPFTVSATTSSGTPVITCTPATFTIGPAGTGTSSGGSSPVRRPPWIEF